MTILEETVEILTATGPMRSLVSRPAAGGQYPGLLLFSEIFQITGPIRRTAALLASHGYVDESGRARRGLFLRHRYP